MPNIGRNDPCLCGSGKKYKKCCLSADQASGQPAAKSGSSASDPDFLITELDSLSNSVLDLIKAKDFDSAETVCQRLRKEYPDQVDGFWRLGMVYEAQGKPALAAKRYREAAEFMQSRDGFDQESIDEMMEKAAKLEA